jgi:hypothetical protein
LLNGAKEHETFWKESSGGTGGIVNNFFRSNFGLSFCCAQERQNSRVSIFQAILEIRPKTIIRDCQGQQQLLEKIEGTVNVFALPG